MLRLFIIKTFKNFTISRGLISYPLRPGDIYASVVIKAIIGQDNGLLPDWHQATTWINDILSIRPWGTHFNDIFEIQKFSFKKMHLKTSSAKWHTFCLSLNVLMAYSTAELNDKKWVQFICILLIPPLHKGCDLCASLVWPQNCPGRRWRQKGGRTVAFVVQGWYTGRSGIAMDAMVAVKFWVCSKQSHKGRRGGRSLTGRSKEAGWRHTHRRGRRMDAQWSAIGRPVKNANIVYQFERHVCLPCTTIVPPLDDQWRPLSDHCGDHCASIQRPRQHLSHHGDGSAFTLPSLRDLLCHYNSFGHSRKAQGSCCSSYTETELSGFRRPLSVLTIFMVAQGWHEGLSPV